MKRSVYIRFILIQLLILMGTAGFVSAETGRTGEPVECEAFFRHCSEHLYYTFDWGDGSVSATAHGSSKRMAYLKHRYNQPGKYTAVWTAVTMSGRQLPGEKTSFDIAGQAVSPVNPPASRGVAYPALSLPANMPMSTAPQANPFHTAWIARIYDKLYSFDEVIIVPAPGVAFPEYFSVEYSMDSGRTWQEIPSANYVHFPDPKGKRVCVPMRGVTADAIRVVSHRPPPGPRGYGLEFSGFDAVCSTRLLFQCDGSPKYNAALNNMWLVFGSAENENHGFGAWYPTDRPDSGGMMGIGSTIWAHWNSLKISWIDTKYSEYYEDMINGYPLDEQGRIGVTVGQWLHLGHSRHYSGQAIFISGVAHYFLAHRDPAILQRKDRFNGMTLIDKVRKVMQYQLKDMQGEKGVLVVTDPDNDGTIKGKSDNYWDGWRFGWMSAYENALFYDSLLKMAMLEEYLGRKPEADQYRTLAVTVREQYNKLFWDEKKGRYIGAIDRLGNRHDYGFTFVNVKAIAYGLAPVDRAQRIIAWLDGQRVVEGDTSTGADIYHFKVGPRANTLAAEAVKPSWWDNWTMEVGKGMPGEYGKQIQNGGMIFYVSYYDLMARLNAVGIANAMKRLDVITDEFCKDQLRRSPGNSFGIMGTLGIIREFPESGLVPLFYLHGIIGVRPEVDGLVIVPHLPDGWSFAEVTEYRYAGQVYYIRVDRNAKEPKIDAVNGLTKLLVPAGSAWKLKLAGDGKKAFERCQP